MCLSFNPQSTLVATGSMDSTAKLWDVQTGTDLCTFLVSQTLLSIMFCRNIHGKENEKVMCK